MQAIVLAAGFGSRLSGHGPSKPLVEVAGRPLLLHALTGLASAVDDVVVVLGHNADRVEAALVGWRLPVPVRTVRVNDWSKPNGVSVLAAEPLVHGRALLTMCDHIVDPALYARLAASDARPGELLLGVDRRIGHAWIDEDDVTRVETDGPRIVAIGKGIEPFGGYDTGVFSIDSSLFVALRRFDSPSLSQGVAVLAEAGLAIAVETGDLCWIDVDDARALGIAEGWIGSERSEAEA